MEFVYHFGKLHIFSSVRLRNVRLRHRQSPAIRRGVPGRSWRHKAMQHDRWVLNCSRAVGVVGVGYPICHQPTMTWGWVVDV